MLDEHGDTLLDGFKPFPKTAPKAFPRKPVAPQPEKPTSDRNRSKPTASPRVAMTFRISEEASSLLGELQKTYAARMGDTTSVSQSKALELTICEAAKHEGLT